MWPFKQTLFPRVRTSSDGEADSLQPDHRTLGALDGSAVLSILLIGTPTWATAQIAAVLPLVEISATSLPITAAAASQHVTVITRAELEIFGDLSIAAVLARQAGVVTDRSPRSGGYGSLYLRGADPSHVVVLVDHVRQNNPLSSRGSAVDLNTLSTGDVERIEIVRGNVSVVHAEALAGVIHIFTRLAPDTAYVGVSAGSAGLRDAHVGMARDRFRASISQREEGDRRTGFSRTQSVNAAWEHALERDGQIAITARLSDSLNLAFPDDSGGQQYAVRRTLEARSARTGQLSARAAINMTASGRIELKAFALSRDGDETTPGVSPGARDPTGLPAISTVTDYRRQEFQAVWLPPLDCPDLLFLLGVQQQHETGQLDSRINFGRFILPARFDIGRRVGSLMAEARYQSTDWTFQGGMRHERPTRGDATNHPMLSAQQALGNLSQWGLSVSLAAKLPSFYALGHPLVGNAALRTERATHRELYYASPESSAWPTRLTLFSARYKDLIDFDPGPPPRLVNRARVNTDGIEWRMRHALANGWQFGLDGTLMRVHDPDGVATLRYRPRAQVGAQLTVPLARESTLTLLASHSGSRLDSSIPTGEQWLPARRTLNLSTRIPLGTTAKGGVATVAIDNLSNSRSQETIGTPISSRQLRIALHWSLS